MSRTFRYTESTTTGKRGGFMRKLFLIASLFITPPLLATDWPQFRGADRSGISSDTKVPLEWSADKNVKWKVPLPNGGNSRPIVWGDRVFLTCAENSKGTRRSLYCFNRADGKQLWVK